MIIIKAGIREMVNFVLRSGDLGYGNMSRKRAIEGILGHQEIQDEREEESSHNSINQPVQSYHKEVALKYETVIDDFKLVLRGRIDGVIEKFQEIIVEEIKTTHAPLKNIDSDSFPAHWGQAFVYGYIFATQNNLTEIIIRLTYYNVESGQRKEFSTTKTVAQLKNFSYKLFEEFVKWEKEKINFSKARDKSIRKLNFPFEKKRDGQDLLLNTIDECIFEDIQLFAEAPTGIGKTVSVLYPAILSLTSGIYDKIFFLTAKTVGRETAEHTLEEMRKTGLVIKSVSLTAKEKICFMDEVNCDPKECPFSKGHFERINNAIFEIYKTDSWGRHNISRIAQKYKVCPFDLSLELATLSDVIIGDYNYVFDPRVALYHIVDPESPKHLLCIDEAHNLVDRARNMYSSEISKTMVLSTRRQLKSVDNAMYKALGAINSTLLAMKKECDSVESGFIVKKELPSKLMNNLEHFTRAVEIWFEDKKARKSKKLKVVEDFYFLALNFNKIAQLAGKEHVTWQQKEGKELKVKIFCIDPSRLLNERYDMVKRTILFSATLSPSEYFTSILGGYENHKSLQIKSPFPKENLLILINSSISTTWKKRKDSIKPISDSILAFTKYKKGNYIVFFPSYNYMKQVADYVSSQSPDFDILIQSRNMGEGMREQFLQNFRELRDTSLVAFALMGGIFGEGIDYSGNQLIGAVVVSVGLPMFGGEQNIIRDYFDEKNGHGFSYAYQFPGFIRVLQSVGRVIRSEEEKGAVLLIDERFIQSRYRKHFPPHWSHYKQVKRSEQIETLTKNFWS